MTSNRTQLIARLSILTALTVVLGYYTKLPTPTGIVTLLDLGVYLQPSIWTQGRCDCRWCRSFSTRPHFRLSSVDVL